MGKSKRRILAKGIHQKLSNLTREEAINLVVSGIDKQEIANVLSLFALKPEELLEAGMSYEQIKEWECYL